ncbi:hypothetical protein D9613_008573 [Agrocybe pediades]|uniref:Uncharacterized protein n=1 Tax=Agrocybe pediades TaxID=84607 RepID=A0A8H4VNJ3_9AGAR|nr:hypothetical protein D9613_008573 [Agrocybe pediades]
MFRACLSSCSRTPASTSQPASAFFHTSTVLSSQATKRKGLRNKKINIAETEKRLQEQAANRPSVILGTRAHEEEAKWKSSFLAKVIINEDDLHSSTAMKPVRVPYGTVNLPKELGYGVDEAEKKILFEDLPLATAEMALNNALIAKKAVANQGTAASLKVREDSEADILVREQEREKRKANLLAKVLDLRNANAAGIAFENRRRIILAFSTPDNPFNPGRTEVQVALLTYQIRKLWDHLVNFKRDVGNRRGLQKLVHQRAKLLRYLRGKDRDRYETILQQLALEPESVEGELVV